MSYNSFKQPNVNKNSVQLKSICSSKLSPINKSNTHSPNKINHTMNLESWIRLKQKYLNQTSFINPCDFNVKSQQQLQHQNTHSTNISNPMKTIANIFNSQPSILRQNYNQVKTQKKSNGNANIRKEEFQFIDLRPKYKMKADFGNEKLAIIKVDMCKNSKINDSLRTKFNIKRNALDNSINRSCQNINKKWYSSITEVQSLCQTGQTSPKNSTRVTRSFYNIINNSLGSHKNSNMNRSIYKQSSGSHIPFYDTQKGQQSTRRKIIKNVIIDSQIRKEPPSNRLKQSDCHSINAENQSRCTSESIDKIRFKKAIIFDMGKMKPRGLKLLSKIKPDEAQQHMNQSFLRQISLKNPMNRLQIDNHFYSFVKKYNLNQDKLKSIFQQNDHT